MEEKIFEKFDSELQSKKELEANVSHQLEDKFNKYFLDKKIDYRNELLQSLKKKIDSLV